MKIKYQISILIVFIFFNSGFSQERVTNFSKSYSIIPNKNWVNYSDETYLTFAQPLKSIDDSYQENISISDIPSNGMSLAEGWNTYIIRDFPVSFKNYQKIQEGNSIIDGQKAKWLECTNSANGLKFKTLVYMVVKNEKVYFIICTATDKDYSDTKPLFLKMVNSFKIAN